MQPEHSASRRLDVLEADAPHLIARPGQAAARVHSSAGTLRMAIATGRREHAETGTVREELWELMYRLAGELGERLGELEREQRHAGAA